MAKLEKDYRESIRMYLKMSYDEKVSICRKAVRSILDSFVTEDKLNVAAIIIHIIGSISLCDQVLPPVEKKFLMDIITIDSVDENYIKNHYGTFKDYRIDSLIKENMDKFTRDTRREFMTIAIAAATVDGSETFHEEEKIKALFNLHNVFDRVYQFYEFY